MASLAKPHVASSHTSVWPPCPACAALRNRPHSEDLDHPLTDIRIAYDRVRHSVFGIGRVVDTSGAGDKSRIRVHFQGWGERNLALEFAKLERL